jgi:flagellum-specific ATP synthase
VIDLSERVARMEGTRLLAPVGRVHDVVGMLVQVSGIVAKTGDRVEVTTGKGKLLVEVIGFREGRLLCAPLDSTEGVKPNDTARLLRHGATIPVGDGLLGRVVDAFGNPLDGKPLTGITGRVPLRRPPPQPFARRAIHTTVETRVRALDAFLPLGRGQRIGLFAGTGVGKSTLLGMMCKRAKADVIVVGLVGERGREVGDFVRNSLGEGLARSVVVAATSDCAPLVRVQGALAATAIAEHFRDQGKHVLLVMDSVTRFAMALREASLAAGEPPITKGYTPSVFAALPALLERAGTCEHEGAITAIYTVLVEGDDLNEPIADAVRGILDGHVVLSRTVAEKGIYPAIDVLASISRLANEIATPEHLSAIQKARTILGTYRDAADLIRIGAYVAGSDPAIDRAIALFPRVEALVKQSVNDDIPRDQSLALLTQTVATVP